MNESIESGASCVSLGFRYCLEEKKKSTHENLCSVFLVM